MSPAETMRAVRCHAPARGPQAADVRVEEVPVPAPGPGELLVAVGAATLGAGDRAVVDARLARPATLPRTLGREATGTIAALGPDVADWQPGDRVAVGATQPCGRCGYCAAGRGNLCVAGTTLGVDRDGTHADYVVTDARFALPVPPEVPDEQAALVPETVALPYHALKRGGVGDGVTASVHGLDALGLHALQLARLAGAQVIGVDADPERCERARDWGADGVVEAAGGDPVSAVHELSEGGVDVSFDFVGSPETVDAAVRCLRPGGRATIAGGDVGAIETVPVARLVADELELVGAAGPTPQDVGELLDLLADGRLDLSRSVSQRLDLTEVPGSLTAGDRAAVGVVVLPG